jgi:hypothetical protein
VASPSEEDKGTFKVARPSEEVRLALNKIVIFVSTIYVTPVRWRSKVRKCKVFKTKEIVKSPATSTDVKENGPEGNFSVNKDISWDRRTYGSPGL